MQLTTVSQEVWRSAKLPWGALGGQGTLRVTLAKLRGELVSTESQMY